MPTLDLYAIGNALVDQEFSIDDAFLGLYQLNKGTMHLSDGLNQQLMADRLNDHTTPAGVAGGGSAANTAFAVAALGSSVFYACRVGNDALGDFYLKDLAAAGVQTSPLSRGLGQTGTCLVMVSPDGERTMHTHLDITTDLSAEQVDAARFQHAAMLYIEGYLASSPSARAAVIQLRAQAREQQTKIALSLSDPSMVVHCREGLLDLLGDGVDILFCNEEEARLFSDRLDINDAIAELHRFSRVVVVTMGANGALIGQRNVGERPEEAVGLIQPISAQTVVDVVDTNGAGDAFAGGFLYGLSQNFTLSDCGLLASLIAAAVVQQYGPRLPRDQYQQILQGMVNQSATF